MPTQRCHRLAVLAPSVLFTLLLALNLTAGCSDDDDNGGTNPPPPGDTVVQLDRVYDAVSFEYPVDIQNAGDGSQRLYVVEQRGRVRYLDPADSTTTPLFLDLTDRVSFTTNSEMGLLGLAFHPDYPTKPYLYVYYTRSEGPRRWGRLSRFTMNAGGDTADPGTEAMLLEVVQPFSNHNGGGLCFGEGTELYLALGDGGSGGDPEDNGQDLTSILGSIIRVDVGMSEDAPPYHGIPATNPFVGNTEGYRTEIFAYGLRNPWRISYDTVEGELWTGDVGQGSWEEVNHVRNGGNYGWDCREGSAPYSPPPGSSSSACPTAGPFIDPVAEYDHSNGDRSITGGFVYRGSEVDELRDRYLFADFSSGRIWIINRNGSGLEEFEDTSLGISSFGTDEGNELYLLGYGSSGGVYRFFERPAPAAN